MTRTFKEAVKN